MNMSSPHYLDLMSLYLDDVNAKQPFVKFCSIAQSLGLDRAIAYYEMAQDDGLHHMAHLIKTSVKGLSAASTC